MSLFIVPVMLSSVSEEGWLRDNMGCSFRRVGVFSFSGFPAFQLSLPTIYDVLSGHFAKRNNK